MTRAIVNLPSRWVTLWVISTPMVTVPFMMPWSVCPRIGRIVKSWLRCTVTTVLWTVIHQRPCVIQRHACQRLRATFFKISIKTQSHGLGILMIQRRNQPFYLPPFQTSWLMGLQGFLLVMPQTFHRIIWQRSLMLLST